MAVTKQSIADYLGVSRTAVSLALNNSPKSTLSEVTSHKIIETAKMMGYPMAQTSSATKKVCLALFNMGTEAAISTNSASVNLIDDYIATHGYSLVYINVKSHEQSLRRFYEYVESGEAAGLVIFSLTDDRVLGRIRRSGVPYVVFSEMTGDQLNCFYPDTHYIARLMLKRLYDAGHRRIAFFAASLTFPQQKTLLCGYREMLEELGLDYNPVLVQSSSTEDGSELAERMELLGVDYTAAICANPRIQFGALSWMRENGICVPADKSLIGYGMNDVVELSIPKLSVYHLKTGSYVAQGMEKLFEWICGDAMTDQPCMRFQGERYFEGGTVASPRLCQTNL